MEKLLPLQRDLLHVTAALTIFRFSIGISGVFIPLIILQKGAPLWTVAAFYLLYACTKLTLNYPITRLIQRYGAHAGLGAGFVAAGIHLINILGFSQTGHFSFLVLGAASLALTNAFVWNSKHVHISRMMDSTTKSSSMATIEIVGQFMDIIAPIVGGLIGYFVGPAGLLVASFALLVTSAIPLRSMGLVKSKAAEVPLRYNLSGAPRRDLFANFCYNIETSIGAMLWPIYLAVALKTYQSIGFVTALAAAATILSVWLAGRRGDRGKDRSVLLQGVSVSSISHLFRIVALTPVSIAAVSVVYKASLAYFQNAWTSTYYAHSKRHGLQYIMSMEIACDVAYVTLWGILLIVLAFSGSSTAFFVVAFVIAAIAAWGCLLMSEQGELTDTNVGE